MAVRLRPATPSIKPLPARLRDLAFALWLLLALAVGAVLAIPLVLGFADRRLLVVTSDSMTPTLEAGDAVVLHPFEDGAIPASGDIVVYRVSSDALLTAHRVVSLHTVDGRPYLRTRGDHNAVPDPNLVPLDAVAGRIGWRIPVLGRWLYWYGRGPTRFLLVGLLTLPVALSEGRALLARRARDRYAEAYRP